MELIDFIGGLGKVKLEGIVTEIYEGTIQKGKSQGQSFFTITLDNGEKISAFGNVGYGYIKGVKEGDKATFEVERQGNYINVTGQTVVDEAYQPGSQSPVGSAPARTERWYKNRISAGQMAVQLAQGGVNVMSDVLADADAIFDWIQGEDS
jgi:hypothetical protein